MNSARVRRSDGLNWPCGDQQKQGTTTRKDLQCLGGSGWGPWLETGCERECRANAGVGEAVLKNAVRDGWAEKGRSETAGVRPLMLLLIQK